MTETAAEFIARKNAQWEQARDVPIETKDVGRQGKHRWVREAWTWHVQHNYGEKAILIERFRNVGHVGTLAFDGGARAGDIEIALATRSSAGSVVRPVVGRGRSSRN